MRRAPLPAGVALAMSSFPSRLAYLAALVGSATLALRPPGAVEHVLALALSPLRLASEVAAPVGLLRARRVRAAERRAASLREAEDLERRALGADQRRFVLPQSAELRAGRSFSIAEVVRRVPGDADRLEVRMLEGRAPEPGQPAVVGDHYIGRVREVDAGGTRAVVELVTRPDVLVGARTVVTDAPARLVVGGLQRDPYGRGRAASLLAIHGPSAPDLDEAPVVVDESLAGGVPFADVAGGFLLGTLETLDERHHERLCGVRSPIDLAAGVFQMALVGPASAAGDALDGASLDPLDDGRWVAARALSRGDPVARREGLKLSVGASRGVATGAAVVSGARLVGVVERTGTHGCDARLLGDPGLALPVVARVQGSERPEILGTLVGLGRASADAEGRASVRFYWEGRSGPRLEGSDVARLYTGAGAEGVPPGLILGDTALPAGGGSAVLELVLEVDPRELAHVRVRTREARP